MHLTVTHGLSFPLPLVGMAPHAPCHHLRPFISPTTSRVSKTLHILPLHPAIPTSYVQYHMMNNHAPTWTSPPLTSTTYPHLTHSSLPILCLLHSTHIAKGENRQHTSRWALELCVIPVSVHQSNVMHTLVMRECQTTLAWMEIWLAP